VVLAALGVFSFESYVSRAFAVFFRVFRRKNMTAEYLVLDSVPLKGVGEGISSQAHKLRARDRG